MSIDYDLKDKQSIIDCAIETNSMKFLRHLWIIQNQKKNTNKKLIKSSLSSKEINTSFLFKKKRSLINYESIRDSNKKIEFFDLSDIITMLKNLRRNNSIRYIYLVLKFC
jgi:hypothetical protein